MITGGGWPAVPVPRWVDVGVEDTLQARARATRRSLLIAASRLIAEHGYHATTLQEILAASGWTKGALYFHFSSKHRLGEDLVTEVFASWDDLTSRIADLGHGPLTTLLICYDAYVGRLMHDATARAARRVVLDEVGIPRAHQWSVAWEKTVEDLLRQARGVGSLRDGVDPARLSRLVLATALGHFQLAEGALHGPNLWDRMNDTWEGLLPAVATSQWCRAWEASGWRTRPAPDREDFRHLGA